MKKLSHIIFRLVTVLGLILATGSCDEIVVDIPGQGQNDAPNEEPNSPNTPDNPEYQDSPSNPANNSFGYILCEGKGVEGVVVSDGYEVVATDAEGKYEFLSSKEHGYVFISIPSGFEVNQNGVIPEFFKYFTKDKTQTERLDFELTKADQSRYKVLFLGDMHLAARSTFHDIQSFREFTTDVSGLITESQEKTYAITLGDMSWDYFWKTNNYDLTNYLKEVNEDFGSKLPIFHTMGNHDNDCSYEGDLMAEATYKAVIGPNYYSFNIGGIHYIVLDDIVYRNYASDGSKRDFYRNITEAQTEWIQKDLKYVSKDTPLVLTMHAPLYYDSGAVCLYNGWSSLIKYLAGYKSSFVTGHTHILYNVDKTDSSVSVYESNSGAVCGAWWVAYANSGIHLCSDGSPAGYRVMDVDGTQSNWNYKGTGRELTYQFRSYDRNQICLSTENWTPNATENGKTKFLETVGDYAQKRSDNEVLLNVWDYDPSWKIEVVENGKSLEVKRLDDVKDPLYLVCYEAYEYEHHYDNSVNYPCSVSDHMFSVKASSASSTLEISITDNNGRTYRESMKRPKEFSIKNYR